MNTEYVLVPRDPDEEMVRAGTLGGLLTPNQASASFQAAVIAAPAPAMNTAAQELLTLIGTYFDLAYAAGYEGRRHDTEAGDEQRTWREIEQRVHAMATPAIPAVDDAMVDSVRADIMANAANDGQTHIVLKDEWVRAALTTTRSGPTINVEHRCPFCAGRIYADKCQNCTKGTARYYENQPSPVTDAQEEGK